MHFPFRFCRFCLFCWRPHVAKKYFCEFTEFIIKISAYARFRLENGNHPFDVRFLWERIFLFTHGCFLRNFFQTKGYRIKFNGSNVRDYQETSYFYFSNDAGILLIFFFAFLQHFLSFTIWNIYLTNETSRFLFLFVKIDSTEQIQISVTTQKSVQTSRNPNQ